MKRRRRSWRAWLWWGILVVILFLAARSVVLTLYPLPYRESVLAWSEVYGVDPYLVAAVIRVESKWQTQATSHKGAIGLMQIMPETASELARRAQIVDFQPLNIYEPEINIRLGTFYLASLIKDFNGNVTMALAAYNGGPRNVQEWVSAGRWDGQETTLERIPFPETRSYVEKVLRDYHRYQWIYGRSD
jgi:soluble lytic murein transglycosylase